jgi:hypothetical protein
MIQLELETPLGKTEQIILCVAFLFKDATWMVLLENSRAYSPE